MFYPGDMVTVYTRATTTGMKRTEGRGKIIRKLGDIPDFYEVECTDEKHEGKILKTFIHESDQPAEILTRELEEDVVTLRRKSFKVLPGGLSQVVYIHHSTNPAVYFSLTLVFIVVLLMVFFPPRRPPTV